MRLSLLSLIVICFFNTTYAQLNDTVQSKEVIISAARSKITFNELSRNVTVISSDEIKKAPIQSVDDLLDYVLNTDVRSRSPLGVQSDVSIRGGSFEQTLILLNGIPLSDPQTGHHSMNLPVALSQIERIEVLHGGGSRIFGEKAFAGAINIITKKNTGTGIGGQVSAGDFGYTQYAAQASGSIKNFSLSGAANYGKSDGYIPNTDFKISQYSAQGNYRFTNGNVMINAGYTNKKFGAQNFYTSFYPSQFEETKTAFGSLIVNYTIKKLELSMNVYARHNRDRFELFREGDDWYVHTGKYFIYQNDTAPLWYTGHNYHATTATGAGINAAYQTDVGKISIGATYRLEDVRSNVLGEKTDHPEHVSGEASDAFYTKSTDRSNMSMYLEDNFTYRSFSLSAGTMVNVNSDYGTDLFPGIDVSYRIIDPIHLYTSFNQSVRFPTFTDLYYNRGGAVGSKNLKPENATNYEGGFKFNTRYAKGNIAYFRRDASNLIDWVRLNGDDTTRATNLTDVTFNGLETQVTVPAFFLGKNTPIQEFRINLSYTDASRESKGFESNYVLDFLSWKGTFSFRQRLLPMVFADWYLNYQKRKGGYYKPGQAAETKYGDFSTLDGRISLQTSKITVYVEASNIFDTPYIDFGNIQQPGRWFKAGCSFYLSK